MKIKMEIDIDPKELREFLGFPDVAGLQKEAVKTVMKKMKSGTEDFDPMTLIKGWTPETFAKADWQGLFKRMLQSGNNTDDDYTEDE